MHGARQGKDLIPGCCKVGWNRYKVTIRAFETIKAKHPVSMVSYLD